MPLAHDGDLVVLQLLGVVLVLELLLREHVGVADLHGTLGNLRDALAGAAALDGDLNAGIVVHVLLRGGLDQRLERG